MIPYNIENFKNSHNIAMGKIPCSIERSKNFQNFGIWNISGIFQKDIKTVKIL